LACLTTSEPICGILPFNLPGYKIPRKPLFQQNILRTGFGRFKSFMQKMEYQTLICTIAENLKTANHVIQSCPIYHHAQVRTLWTSDLDPNKQTLSVIN